MDKVWDKNRLKQAFQAVKANNGAPGADGETVYAFAVNLEEEISQLHHELKTGQYKPKPVRRVEIPKANGKTRPLGIPSVRDRIVQESLRLILEPIFEPDFHPSSYGYRPGRSCQQAVAKAERFLNRYGLEYVVDMDLSKCFDRLDHELILKQVNRKVSDGSILRLIREFLTAGVMQGNSIEATEIGSPQGGVISPLLANIYLDAFDQEMKQRGIRIVRYADDILVFARNEKEAKQYQKIATEILEGQLKLTVNKEKTHITHVGKGVRYLGFMIYRKVVGIDPDKIKAFKVKIKGLTPRNHGKNVEQVVMELNPVLRGWINYYRIANCKGILAEIMQWLRRRLRMKKMKEWKTWKALHKELRRRGYHGRFERISVTTWRNSVSPLVHLALPDKWFKEMGLVDLTTYQVGVLHYYYEK